MHRQTNQPTWHRIILLWILGYEAAGCLAGRSMLVVAPDGRLMNMPVDIMHGSFADFSAPGIILFGLGLLNAAAFFTVKRRKSGGWILAVLALGGLAIWFWVEIAILLQLHWLHLMWGLPVVVGLLTTASMIPQQMLTAILLLCGILSSIQYVAINIVVPLQWSEYNAASQTISELSAVAAPTRELWLFLSAPYAVLMLTFSLGILQTAGSNHSLRIAGVLMVVYAVSGILWPFVPMHSRVVLAAGGGTFSDTAHLILGAVTELIYIGALGFAAFAFGKWFRAYSLGVFVVIILFGVLTFLEAGGIARNQPTPFIGIWERVNIGLFLIWIIVLAVMLLSRIRTIN